VVVSLVPFASVDRTTLQWLRTSETSPEFTLLAGDAPVAIIRWVHHPGARATVETTDGTWVLGRRGFLVPRLTVQREGTDAPIARLTNRLGQHEIEVGGGGSYRFQRAGILLPAWKLSDGDGKERLHIEPVAEAHRLAGGAVIVTGTTPPGELLLLLILSWYLIVLLWIEDEAIEALVPFEGPDAPARLGQGGA
jgi:hypothetical protein